MSKVEVKLKSQLRRSAGKSTSMHLLLAGNDTVPILMWRGGGMRSSECRLVVILSVIIRPHICSIS